MCVPPLASPTLSSATAKLAWQCRVTNGKLATVWEITKQEGSREMIGLVRLALRRPYTSAIAAMLILLMGALSITRMIVDIFPVIDIPVVLVVWNYNGLTTEDMERRVVFISERAYSTTVNGISRIESQSIPSIGILKVYFQPGTDIGGAIAQITSVNNSILRSAPPGMQPPGVIQFNASNVPVVQMTLSSKTLTEQQIFDYSLNFIRIRLFTIPGLSTPGPFGGKQRQINVDLDPVAAAGQRLLAGRRGQRAAGVERDRSCRNRAYRRARIQRAVEFQPADGRSVQCPADRRVQRRAGHARRRGHVSDSFATQTNVVHVNGKRAVYLAILKHADASTLAVVDAARDALPEIQAAAPDGLELKLDFDQSVFVRAAVQNVIREAIISSILVSVMILVFLGSWRNTVIVSASIPLSIFAGIVGLFLTGNTINLMTLGGLALAIGLLVDNATVTIENIHRNQSLGKPLTVAILDGSARGDPAADRRHAGDLHRVLPGRAAVRRRRASCSSRSPSPSCSACSPRTCCRSAWCRASRASCWREARPSRTAARLLRRFRPRLQPLPRRLWPDAGRHAEPSGVRADLRRPRCWWSPAA